MQLAGFEVQTEPLVNFDMDHYRVLHQRLIEHEELLYGSSMQVQVGIIVVYHRESFSYCRHKYPLGAVKSMYGPLFSFCALIIICVVVESVVHKSRCLTVDVGALIV